MSDIARTRPDWRQLCQEALFEVDPVKLLERIADARSAMLDRIEDGFTRSQDDEQIELRVALSMLDKLAQNYPTSKPSSIEE
jgi:hypothetical protein